jgi:hypothetical protein
MKLKIAFYIALAIALVFLIINVINLFGENDRLHQELIGQTQQYVQLSEHAAKLEIQYKTQEDLKKEAEKKFKKELGAMEDKIKVLSDATFLIKEKARETNNSDVVFNGENSQFVLNEIRFENGPPVGYVLIFKDGRVVSKIYNNQVQVSTAVTKDEDSGRYSIISKADFILKSPSLNPNGKVWTNVPFPLKIVGGTALVDPTEPNQLVKKFHWWNPKVNANLNFDLDGIYPGTGISFVSYGKTKNDLDYKFLEVGGQFRNNKVEPILVPVLWRPFEGLFSNTYIGPGVVYEFPGFGYFLGIQVGL